MSETLVSAATVVLHSCPHCGRSILLADRECPNCVAARMQTEIDLLAAQLARHESLEAQHAAMVRTLEAIGVARSREVPS